MMPWDMRPTAPAGDGVRSEPDLVVTAEKVIDADEAGEDMEETKGALRDVRDR